jgi:primosomal protein N' (replication factor Y) (superfamily II helicase)
MEKVEFNSEVISELTTLFVDVILPVPIPQLFTYRVPQEMNEQMQVGMRVIVQFGSRKVLTAIVAKLHQKPPQNYQAKYVLELLDDSPTVTVGQIQLFQWMADYYMCNIGEVLNIALPSGLKISSLSKIQLRPDAVLEGKQLNEKELRLLDALQDDASLTYDEAAEVLGVDNVYHLIKVLIAKEIVLVYEEVREKYAPKIVKKIRLSRDYLMKTDLEKLSKKLEKTPKQLDILLAYLRHVPVLRDWTLNETGIEKDFFHKNENLSISSLNTLLKNGILEEFEIVVSRFAEYAHIDFPKMQLSPKQRETGEKVMDLFFNQQKEVVLLHGVTGSGKTEIYIDLIQKVLAGGSQVLFLLPEIALTTQIVARLQKIFGTQMGVYHSKFSDNERVEVWRGVLSGRFSFVVGVRSAIFLPFDNLGLIIVDEEHEPSYKQYEPAPRYHARDMAMVMARIQNCKVLLGSATPSTETFYHAKMGKFGLVQLKERFGDAELPEIVLADLKTERKEKTIKGHFSAALLDEIKIKLDSQEQVILFQNRRGYSPYMSCRQCNTIPHCPNCAVSLTYHLSNHELRCHYCGHIEPPPKKCVACGSTKIETVGLGTEKIEDDLKVYFPNANVQRMDLDTTRTKNSYQQIISDFENHNIDILVGTQMVSKGLDFDNVSLVGIFDADRMLNFPDFRATERAFQIMLQVSGRAGRKHIKGKVIIQTANIEQEILGKIIRNDYEAMYLSEIEDRAYFFYPPFTRLIRLTAKHLERALSLETIQVITDKLVAKLGKARVLGPQAPLVHKIRNKYLYNVLIKIERENVDLKATKAFIQSQIEEVLSEKKYKQVQVVVDVDPV